MRANQSHLFNCHPRNSYTLLCNKTDETDEIFRSILDIGFKLRFETVLSVTKWGKKPVSMRHKMQTHSIDKKDSYSNTVLERSETTPSIHEKG